MNNIALVISCEHAVDTVPLEYLPLFKGYDALLATHRGIDFGALAIAQHLQHFFGCDFVQATATRLLIDCNRSLNNPQCFSEVTRNLDQTKKQQIIDQYYLPFRQQVLTYISKQIQAGHMVWHLSIHSFTPIMDGLVRNADIGLLYNPQRAAEKELAKQWKQEIIALHPHYKVRMNYPYSGISDGFTSILRKKFSNNQYLGMEVESNQALTKDAQIIDTLKNILTNSLGKLLS